MASLPNPEHEREHNAGRRTADDDHGLAPQPRKPRPPVLLRTCRERSGLRAFSRLALALMNLRDHAGWEFVPKFSWPLRYPGSLQKLIQFRVLHLLGGESSSPLRICLSFRRAANKRHEMVVSEQPSALAASACVRPS